MNPAPLQIGDVVQIVGPDWCDGKSRLNAIFQITEESCHGFSTAGQSWYPASSLRKVRIMDEDELQIGDWAEVVGPDEQGFGHTIGEKFQITHINRDDAPFKWASGSGKAIYPASSLRKLTPEDVQEHHRTHEGPIFPPRLENIEQRLSAIESKLADISPKDRQFSPGETVGEAFQDHLDKINEALEPLAEMSLRKKAGSKLTKAIIPQAKYAKILQNNLEGVELAQKLTGLSYRDEIELLKRYLAAIEGGKP